jgi:hypothetical protein
MASTSASIAIHAHPAIHTLTFDPIIHTVSFIPSRPHLLLHRCGDGHGLQLEDRSRFRAASHLYDEEVVTGARLARTDFEDDGHGGRVT